MKWIVLGFAIVVGIGIIYELVQVSQGDHDHHQEATSSAVAAILNMGLAGFLFWAFSVWG